MKKFLSSVLLSLSLLSACSSSVPYSPTLTKANLEESLTLGSQFLVNNQTSLGNFNYSYNFVSKELSADDNQVRQAGAVWGLALLYAHSPSQEVEDALFKALDFYGTNPIPSYLDDDKGSTGSLALLCLSLLDALSVDSTPRREELEAQLKVWLETLKKIQNEDLEFYGKYDYTTGEGKASSSPYSDGEALLALSKAANYFASDTYFELADQALDAMWQDHVVDAQKETLDSDETKGFYQWVTMSLYELDKYQSSKGEVDTKYVEKAVELANWMVDTHKILDRTRNTAYAFEGLIATYKLAELHNQDGDYDSELDKLFQVIDTGLFKLTTWQVGHTLQNEYLETNAQNDALALGGIVNAADEADLRIDVTQHQMHAVIMTLEWIYK